MGSQPTAPSPAENLANAQAVAGGQQQYNIGAQAGSQYDQNNYYGGLNYQQTGVGPGGVPLYSATTSYSPTQLEAANQTTGTQLEAGSQAANALGFGNYGSISPTQQIGNATSGTTGQLENMYLQSVEPFFQTQQQQLDTQLQNQGFTSAPGATGGNNPNGPTSTGDPAYNNAMRQLITSQDQAALGAAAQFEPQAFTQANQLYQLPMSVGQQLYNWGAPISPTNQFTNQLPSLQAPNLVSADQTVGQQAWNQYQSQQAQYNAMISALGGGAGALGAIGLAPFTGGLSLAGLGLMGMGGGGKVGF